MIHPHTELRYINEQIGFGVFAKEFIPKGTITWVLDQFDQILEPQVVEAADSYSRADIQKYSYRNEEGKYILCWDLGRFVNHSFHANCMGTAYEFEIAIRDIYPGEQLTDDYGTLNIDEPFLCIPEEGTERKMVYPDDLLKFYKEWDKKVIKAMRYFYDVEQPLLHLIRPEFMGKIETAAKKQILLDSIKKLYFNRPANKETIRIQR
ncbi:SET domain-containing protein [Solibacillus sp. FSL H8-0538]|uniref:SET domain-containing protein n=1 Tax=Solibacillus sp. FSL H8-0538 TaxID=2921400 RepID=UPI0030FB9345